MPTGAAPTASARKVSEGRSPRPIRTTSTSWARPSASRASRMKKSGRRARSSRRATAIAGNRKNRRTPDETPPDLGALDPTEEGAEKPDGSAGLLHPAARLLGARGADGGLDFLLFFRRRQHRGHAERLDPQLPAPTGRVIEVFVLF